MHVRFQFLGKKRPQAPELPGVPAEGMRFDYSTRRENPYWIEPPKYVSMGYSPGRLCETESPNFGCHCTLEKGHSGDHVAHTYTIDPEMLARWPQEKAQATGGHYTEFDPPIEEGHRLYLEESTGPPTCRLRSNGWFCTRSAGHEGDHFAHVSRNRGRARWPRGENE